MNRFAALCAALDRTTDESVKTDALAAYFNQAPDDDRLWAIALLSGRRPKRMITGARLRLWAAEAAGIPLWLFDASHAIAGDLAEAIALVLPHPAQTDERTLSDWITPIISRAPQGDPAKRAAILSAWNSLPPQQRIVFNKLVTGSFRISVGAKLMTRALSRVTTISETDVAHRLASDWAPDATTFAALLRSNAPDTDLSRPYPFHRAHRLDDLDALGPISDWQAERKWDGIRGQLILRGGQHHLWSRDQELITDRFPEFVRMVDLLPEGTVIDGEILGWSGDAPLPLQAMQNRIRPKTVSKKLLAQAPALMMAYDLLEHRGIDIRHRPLTERRALLAELIAPLPPASALRLSPEVRVTSWAAAARERGKSRTLGTEGLMLKRRAAPYGEGCDWRTWRSNPLTIDAVMIYAHAGKGQQALPDLDYTFAVWDGPDLIPFAKVASGLPLAEMEQITAWVRKNTIQRFGPVRQVTPYHVFEIAFDGIQPSPRHKSGVALRSPRMLRWRQDRQARQAHTLDDLKTMLAPTR